MKNIIRINLDVNERNESNIGIPLPQKVIRSKDTAVIIEMRIIGYDVNDGYTFTLLSEYTKSKRHTLYTLGDRLKIEGNVVTFVPPAELISTLEIVTNTLYIEKSGVSLDFSKFHYLAQLSEVDNTVGPVKEVYDDNYQALIDELEFKYMLIEDLTAEYVAAQVAEARVGEDGTIYRFLKERLDVEHQKVIAQVGEVTNQLELTNNEIIDARGGKPTLRVRLNEIDRVDETGKHWTLIDGEWEERVGQSQLINVHGEVAWAMAEAEQARADAIKAYEDAVAEAKRSADIEDALIRNKIEQEISAVEEELSTAKQEAKDASNKALTDAKAHADAEVQASKEYFDSVIEEVESDVADAQSTADSAVNQIDTAVENAGFTSLDDTINNVRDIASGVKSELDTAVENAGFTSLDETISSVQSISNQAQINSSKAIDDAQDAMSSASTAISSANQAKEDAQTAITEAGEAIDSANTAKTNAQTALEDAQIALSTAENADTKSGLAEAAANTAKTNAQTAIDDAQSALTTAGNAKTTADTLSIKVDDLEGEVELKASQTEVDGISGTVSTHTTTLSQHATAISSKAESELVDTIKGTVDTHTTEISQNATDIASKANTATVNTLTGRVDTAESNISQNATAITQRVTTTTYNAGIGSKENTVLKQTTAPTHSNGRLWLDTSVTPNILKRSNGSTWIKATPTTPGEVGAYSQSEGAGLAGRLTTAETNITQTATAITSKADKSTVDTLEGIVSTQGTTITQQADLIASKASQTEVDTVKGTVSGHTTTLSQHANQIASKAETNLVNAIKGTVDNHTTEISQNATDIASKASSSSVNTLTGRVSTAETTISQHATEITSKASQTEVDTVKGTVAGHTTTISQHATAIASKAESNLVNTIKGTVDTHTTEISQNSTDIASKASSSSVNALTGRVSTAETGISENAGAIKLKANQSTVDTLAGTVSTLGSEFDVVAGQVSSKVWMTDIDGIEVGGRNLIIRNTETPNTFINLSGAIVTALNYDTSDYIKVEPNTDYILTKSDSELPTDDFFRWSWYDADKVHIGRTAFTDNEILWRTRTTAHYVRVAYPTDSFPKLEKGNKATDWTPAPEDTDYKFDHIESEWTQTFESFEQTIIGEGGINRQLQTLNSTMSSITDPVTGRLSIVEQTASGLQSQVFDSNGNSRITQLSTGIQSVVTGLDNLDIGGRNLFITSSAKQGFVDLDGSIQEDSDNYLARESLTTYPIISVKSGERYYFTKITTGESSPDTWRVALFSGNGSGLVQRRTFYNDTFSIVIPSGATTMRASIAKEARPKIEKGDKATHWTPAPEDTATTAQLSIEAGRINALNTRIGSNEKFINELSLTPDGFWVRTARYDMATGRIEAIATLEQTVGGLQSTVADKASQTQVTQLANGVNMLAKSRENLVYKSWFEDDDAGGWSSGTVGEQSSLIDLVGRSKALVWSSRSTGEHGNRIEVVGGETYYFEAYINAFHSNYAVQFGAFLEPTESYEFEDFIPAISVPAGRGNNLATGTITIPEGRTVMRPLLRINGQSNFGFAYAAGMSITKNATQGQLSILQDNINLRVSKEGLLSQINIAADRTLIQSNKLVLDANSVVFTGNAFIPSAQIQSVHADKINAGTINSARIDAKTIVTNGLAANVVSSNHIIANEALVDKVFSNQASVDRLWAKNIWTNKITAMEIDAGKITSGTINTARLNVTDLRTKLLTANVIDATQINASAAVFNKLFSTSSATSRLVAQGAWIENANIKGINADKINAGTISADRISTSSLDNLEIGGRNLFIVSSAKQGYVDFDGSIINATTGLAADSMTTYPIIRVYPTETYYFTKLTTGASSPDTWRIALFSGTGSGLVQRITNSSGSFSVTIPSGVMTMRASIAKEARPKIEKGNKPTDWTPAPEDIINDLGSSGKVEIHGGNIKADTLDVGAITGNLGEFINLSLKAQNSQASLSGASFRIESIANTQSYIEMSNAPEIRARSADSSMAVMGQGRTSYHYDGSERFYFGSKLNGWQNGMMIRKHHGWGIMRESDSSNGVPAKYYQVPAGYQRVAVIEALMRDPTVTEVPTGNETQFIINSNYLGRLNGYTNSTSSTIAYPWPTLRTGDLIKYAEEIPGNESGVQQVFDIWDDNNTTVSAFGVHVTFHGGYSGASDRNIKHDIKDTAVEALAHIESLTFKEFRYNQDNRYEPIGMIAQDSGILRVKSDKVESIDIQRSIMLSLKGLQELQDIVKRQAEEIKQLKEIINQ